MLIFTLNNTQLKQLAPYLQPKSGSDYDIQNITTFHYGRSTSTATWTPMPLLLVPREGHIPPWTNDMIALLGIVKRPFSGNQSTPMKELGETTQERMVHKGYTTQGIVHRS